MVEEIEQYFKEELLIGDYKENLSSEFKLYVSGRSLFFIAKIFNFKNITIKFIVFITLLEKH
jgi:hypothetical protein